MSAAVIALIEARLREAAALAHGKRKTNLDDAHVLRVLLDLDPVRRLVERCAHDVSRLTATVDARVAALPERRWFERKKPEDLGALNEACKDALRVPVHEADIRMFLHLVVPIDEELALRAKLVLSHGSWEEARRERKGEPFRRSANTVVTLHDDPFTTMEFVVEVLTTVFNLASDDAVAVMQRVHETGGASLEPVSDDVAHERVTEATKRARESGFPLRFSIEP